MFCAGDTCSEMGEERIFFEGVLNSNSGTMKKIYSKLAIFNELRTGKARWLLFSVAAILILCSGRINAQSFTIDQVRNGSATDPAATNTDASTWVNGNLTPQHAHYAEGFSVPYRAVATGLTVGTPVTLVIGYDTKDGGKNALDYLTHFQRLDPHAVTFSHTAEIINPTLGISGLSATTDQILITAPASMVLPNNVPSGSSQPLTSYNALPEAQKKMTIFGGTFTAGSFQYVQQESVTLDHAETRIRVTFTPASSTVVIAWGGHIASRLDWGETDGVPNSAGGINGSPYHMRLIEYKIGTTTVSLGNQDRSLKASAVAAPPPMCQVIPSIHEVCVGDSATFMASATSGTPPYTFNWYRNNYATVIATGTTFTVNNVQFSDTGEYQVIVTDAAGLKDTCHAHLRAVPLPPCDIAAPVAFGGGGTIKCNTPGNTISTSSPIDTTLYTLNWAIIDTAGQTGWSITSGQGSNTITFTSGACGAAGDSVKIRLIVTDKTYGCVSTCYRKIIPQPPQCSVSINSHGNLTCTTTQLTLVAVITTDNPNPTILWTASNGGNIVSGATNDSVVINDPGKYKITVTDVINGCIARDSTIVIEDAGGPTCLISGNGADCDSLTKVYTGPTPSTSDTTYSYKWRVSGTASISGDSTNATVTVVASQYCNSDYTVMLEVTNNVNGCKSNCQRNFTHTDNTDPVMSGIGRDTIINCPGTPVFTAPTATDNCDPNPRVDLVKDTTIAGQCPGSYIRIKTWKAVDICGNASAEQSQSITVQDTTAPSISGEGRDTTVNCTTTPGFTAPTADDECDPEPQIVMVSDTTIAGNCAAGSVRKRSWKAVDACGNESPVVEQVITIQDTIAPVLSGAGRDTTLNCPETPDFTKPTATDNCDPSPVVTTIKDTTITRGCLIARTKTWQATDACGNVSDPVSQTITVQDTTAPVIGSAGRDTTINCPGRPVFTPPTATDACDQNPDIVLVSDTTIGGGTAPGQCPGAYTRIMTWKAIDTCGNESGLVTQTIVVQDTTAPDLGKPGSDTTIVCSGTPSFTPPTATDDCDEAPDVIEVNSTQSSNSDGSVTYTKTWKAEDACGNESATAEQSITVPSCRKENCSLTQGFYGNMGGKACATGQGTLALIQSLLSGSDLVVGKPGRSLTINLRDANCVILRLPGNGSPSLLPAGDGTFTAGCNTSTNIPLKAKKFHNVLLGQTIALGLNMRLDGGLGSVLITDNWLVTKGADKSDDGLCGTVDDVIIDSLVLGKFIPQSVIDALTSIYGSGNETVANLFDLANRALGGQSLGGSNLSDINRAVSSINEGFDGCRFLVGFQSTDPTATAGTNLIKTKALGFSMFKDAPKEKFSVYPNPFNETINFELEAATSGNISIEFFNTAGSRIAVIYKGQAGPEKALKFDLDTKALAPGMYLCKFTNGNNITVVRKVILSR